MTGTYHKCITYHGSSLHQCNQFCFTWRPIYINPLGKTKPVWWIAVYSYVWQKSTFATYGMERWKSITRFFLSPLIFTWQLTSIAQIPEFYMSMQYTTINGKEMHSHGKCWVVCTRIALMLSKQPNSIFFPHFYTISLMIILPLWHSTFKKIVLNILSSPLCYKSH